MDSKDNFIPEIKTPGAGGWKQVVATMILSIGVGLAVYMILFERAAGDSTIAAILLLGVAALFYLVIVSNLIRGWVLHGYQVRLGECGVTYRNLFGRERSFQYAKVQSVKRMSGRYAIEFITADSVYAFNPNIDYIGFLNDYVLERIDPSAEIDSNSVSQFRNRGDLWIYGRAYPFSTQYGAEEISQIEGAVNNQRARLMESGILHLDIEYKDAREGAL